MFSFVDLCLEAVRHDLIRIFRDGAYDVAIIPGYGPIIVRSLKNTPAYVIPPHL